MPAGRRGPPTQCSAAAACRGWCQKTLAPASAGTPGTASQPGVKKALSITMASKHMFSSHMASGQHWTLVL